MPLGLPTACLRWPPKSCLSDLLPSTPLVLSLDCSNCLLTSQCPPSPQCPSALSKMQIWLDHLSALKPSIAPCAPQNKVQTPLPGVRGRKREKKKKWFARTFYQEQRKPGGGRMIPSKHWKKITVILETEWNFFQDLCTQWKCLSRTRGNNNIYKYKNWLCQ